MLKDASQGSYSDHKVRIHPNYGNWKEYIPASEEDFKKHARKIVDAFDKLKIGIRISSVNAALRHVDRPEMQVSFESTQEEWVEAYWTLYCKNFICMAYLVEDRSIKQMFALPADKRHQRAH